MKKITIHGISCRPGYGDMHGDYHEIVLEKDKNGNRTYVCRDREDYRSPMVTTVYGVSDEAVEQIAAFISKHKVLSLEKRPKSTMFVTDYSPWSYYIEYETASLGKTKRKSCCITEYKMYSKRDYELIQAFKERFLALRGEQLSRTVEDKER